MLFDHTHPCYAGDVGIGINPSLKARIKTADLVLLLGGRLSEIPSQDYTLLGVPSPEQTLVHVYPGAEELGRIYRPTLAIHASPVALVEALACRQYPAPPASRMQLLSSAHAEYLDRKSVV